jgi:hypothetical protein
VVLGRDGQVLLAGPPRQRHPGLGVELGRVELLGERLVLGDRDPGPEHDPFADAGDRLALPPSGRDRVKPPVDEHPEAGLAPPIEARVLARLRPLGLAVANHAALRIDRHLDPSLAVQRSNAAI